MTWIEKKLCAQPNPSILRALEAILEIEGGRPDDDAILLAHLRNHLDLMLADCIRAVTEERLYDDYCSPV